MNYQTPPPGGYYHFASASPSPQGPHGYYPPRAGPSPRMHSRHQSQDYSPRPTSSYPSPRYSSKGHYSTAPGFSSPGDHAEYVSARGTKPDRTARCYASWHPPRREPPSYRASYEESDEDEFLYEEDGFIYVIPARSRPTKTYFYTSRGQGTDRWFSQGYRHGFDRSGTPIIITEESPSYERFDDTPRRQHTRRHSTAAPPRPATARPSSSPRKTAPMPETRKATAADAAAYKIPPGYSLKNWDPTEEPIILLGSVFDANSLGKWIFDWTVYHHGPRQPISEMAGDLWLLLIQLAGKMKRAEECIPRTRKDESREILEEFTEAGERLMDRLKKLLRACEAPMLRAGVKQRSSSKDEPNQPLQLGKNAGIQFVESLFGRDRQLPNTEQFMHSIRLWNMRFDVNCEDILSHPYA